MNSKLCKKCLSILLTVCLVVALIPASAFASEEYVSDDKMAEMTSTEYESIMGEFVPDESEYTMGDTVTARVIIYPENETEKNTHLMAIDLYINYDSSCLALETIDEAAGWTLMPSEDMNRLIFVWDVSEKEPRMLEDGQMVATLQFTTIKPASSEIALAEIQALTSNGEKIAAKIGKAYTVQVSNREKLNIDKVFFQVEPGSGTLYGESFAFICREYPGIYKDEQCTEPFELPKVEPAEYFKIDSVFKWKNLETGYIYTDEGLLRAKFDEHGMTIVPNFSEYCKYVKDAEGNVSEHIYDSKDRLIKVVDPLGNVWSKEYNDNGQIISETTPLGYTTRYEYDEQGRLLKKTYPDGTSDTYIFDKEGRLVSYTRPGGTTEKYEYDSNNIIYRTKTYDAEGNLISVVDKNYTTQGLSEIEEVIDAEGRKNETASWPIKTGTITQVIDGNGNITRYYFNLKEQLVKIEDPMGLETVYTYDQNGNITCTEYLDQKNEENGFYSKTTYEYEYYEGTDKIKKTVKIDGEGNCYISTYDEEGNVLTETDPRGNTTSYEYDKLNRCTAKISPLGARTEYVYDHNNQVCTIREGLNGEVVTQYRYDADGRMISKTDAEGVSYSYEYDSRNRKTITKDEDGKIIERFVYDEAGNLASYTDGNGNTTSYTYDALGRLLTETDPEGNTKENVYNSNGEIVEYIDESGRAASFEYDNNGNITKITDKAGNVTTFTYDANNRQTSTVVKAGDTELVTSFTYDSMGNMLSVTMPDGGVVRASYDNNNQVISNTDAMGNTEYREYDENGNVISVTDFRGNTTKYEYDAENRNIRTIDALGNETTYTYDDQGRLTSSTMVIDGRTIVQKTIYDEAGRVVASLNELADSEASKENIVRYEYDNHGRLSKEIYEDGNSYTSYSYDGNGNVLRQSYYSNGKEYTFEYLYDKKGQVVSIKDPLGNQTLYKYTPTGEVESEIDALGGKTSYTYDVNDNVISITDANGYTVSYEYDEQQRVIKATDANGNVYGYEYDKSGNLFKVINPDGGEEVYEYDLNNRLISEKDSENYTVKYSYDENGNQTSVTDANGNTSKAVYDALDRKIADINAEGGITEYTYDAIGRLIQVKDADGAITSYEYDAKGRVERIWDAYGNIRSYAYDPMDRVIEEIDENGNSRKYEYDGLDNVVKYTDELGAVTTYTYDLNGNCIMACDSMGGVYSYTYDKLNRLISQTDPEGSTVRYEYDSLGNVIKETDGRDNTTEYSYDGNGNLVSITDALGNVTVLTYDRMNRLVSQSVCRIDEVHGINENQEISYTYDHKGQVITATDALGLQKSFEYDGNGNLIKYTNEEGQSTYYTYTPLNIIKSIKYSDEAEVLYRYDKTGALVEMRDETGVTSIGVDLLDRITSVKNPEGKTVEYEYDAAGNLSALNYPDGNKVEYEYDAAGNMIYLYDEASKVKAFQCYNAAGMVTHREYANGDFTEYEYDMLGRIITMNEYTADASLRYMTSYAYDESGNRTKSERVTFENGNVIPEETKAELYSYDELNHLTGYSDGENVTVYTYDSVGNLVYESGSQGETHYWYNDRNQLVYTQGTEGLVTYIYDKIGNRISEIGKEGVYKYLYDSAGNLSIAETPEGDITMYRYNGLGMRVESETKTGGNYKEVITKSYFPDFTSYEKDDLYMETRGLESFATIYIYAGIERVSQITRDLVTGKEKILYIHEDIMGSTSFFTGEDGSLYGNVTYDPWGKPELSKELLKDETIEIAFTGHPYDKILGVYFAEARFYDPETRAFISEDPARDGINWYQYCSSNPVTYWDPTGMSFVDDVVEEWQQDPGAAALKTCVTFAGMALGITVGILTGGMGLFLGTMASATCGMACGMAGSAINAIIDHFKTEDTLDTIDSNAVAASMVLSGISSFTSGLIGGLLGGLYSNSVFKEQHELIQAFLRFELGTVTNFAVGIEKIWLEGVFKGYDADYMQEYMHETVANRWWDILIQAASSSAVNVAFRWACGLIKREEPDDLRVPLLPKDKTLRISSPKKLFPYDAALKKLEVQAREPLSI